MTFTSSVLSIEQEGNTGIIYLDRPEARNAMGPAFWEDFPVAVQTLEENPDIYVILIAARGPSFSVGLDLKSMTGSLRADEKHSHAEASQKLYREVKKMQKAFNALSTSTKPVIASVNGHCIGAGIDLLAACDIRLASGDAIFSIREVRMAIVADLGTLQRLTSVINPGHLAELAFTGKDIDAREAREIGLVSRVYDTPEVLATAALEMATEISQNSPLVVQGIKSILHQQKALAETAGLDYVALWNAAFLQSNDLQEAVSAFLEKRSPKFEGR